MKSHEMLGAAEQRNKTRCAYREATKNKSEIVLYTSSRVDCRDGVEDESVSVRG